MKQLSIKRIELNRQIRCRESTVLPQSRLPTMKITLCRYLPALLLALPLGAAPLMETTAIHAQPDGASSAIGYLKAGTEPVAAPNVTAPDGWMAVSMPGPHEAYVSNSDLTKGLEVRPGAALRTLPKADAPILTIKEEADKIEVTGLRPGWTQVKLNRDAVGYIKLGGSASAVSAAAPAPAPAAMPPPPVLAAGQTAPVLAGGPAGALPHMYQGMLVPTKRFLLVGPRPGFDYQLNNVDGRRIAYLDVSKVLATVKMEKYVDNPVVVSGVLRQTYDGKNLVIDVITLDLR